MNKILKSLLTLIIIYHFLIFYILKNELNNQFIEIKYCICSSNPLTNTYYICSSNKIQKYLTNIFLSDENLKMFNYNNPLYDIYTFLIPIKFIHSNNRLCF